MSQKDDDARHLASAKAVVAKIKELAGEHCEGFAFIGRFPDENGDAITISQWGGAMDTVIGLAERMKERMRQTIIANDYPNTPPADDDEDWKGAEL